MAIAESMMGAPCVADEVAEAPSIRWQPLGEGRQAPAGSFRDPGLAALLAGYKEDVARRYQSLPPDRTHESLPPGSIVISPKLDGETWFLKKDAGGARLLSPTGRIIHAIGLTAEAERLLGGWQGLMAGELYAVVDIGRPHVFDLHAALGGGPAAETQRLRWAAFDLLRDGDGNAQALPFIKRTQRLQELLQSGQSIHAVAFEELDGGVAVREAFERIVTRGGAEGIVALSEDGRAWKIKPQITLDAAVVGFVRGIRVSVNCCWRSGATILQQTVPMTSNAPRPVMGLPKPRVAITSSSAGSAPA